MRCVSELQCMGRQRSVITTGDFNFGLIPVPILCDLLDPNQPFTYVLERRQVGNDFVRLTDPL